MEEIFGPKMHEDFPRKLLESPTCGNGFWEGNSHRIYKHSGIMLRVEAGEDVSIHLYPTVTNPVINVNNLITIYTRISTIPSLFVIHYNVAIYIYRR